MIDRVLYPYLRLPPQTASFQQDLQQACILDKIPKAGEEIEKQSFQVE